MLQLNIFWNNQVECCRLWTWAVCLIITSQIHLSSENYKFSNSPRWYFFCKLEQFWLKPLIIYVLLSDNFNNTNVLHGFTLQCSFICELGWSGQTIMLRTLWGVACSKVQRPSTLGISPIAFVQLYFYEAGKLSCFRTLLHISITPTCQWTMVQTSWTSLLYIFT